MAKLTPTQWRHVREAYEVGCKSTVMLAKEFGIADTTIQRRIRKDKWNREKTQDVIEKKVSAAKAFTELTQENAGITQAVNKEVAKRLEDEGFYASSTKFNQGVANKFFKENVAKGSVDMNMIQGHSQVTARNKESTLGKQPTTQVNIQNNVGSDADAIIDALMAKHS